MITIVLHISDCNGSDTNSTGLRFLTQSQTRMMIDSGGNVGIGTTTPTAQLHINEDSSSKNTQLKLTHNTSGFGNDTDGFDLVLERTSNRAYIIQRENANMYLELIIQIG